MTNISLLFIAAVIDLTVVFIAYRSGTKWLYATIIINLLLVSVFGTKLISVFGFITNAANVFYACSFFAVHLLLENKKDKEAVGTIWFGVAFIVFFLAMALLIIRLSSFSSTDPVSGALAFLFPLSVRIIMASLIAYVFSQYLNIKIYRYLSKKYNGKHLWFRSGLANIIAQLLDSSLFFTIAFIDLPVDSLMQAIFVSLIIKSLVVSMGTPYLYMSRGLQK